MSKDFEEEKFAVENDSEWGRVRVMEVYGRGMAQFVVDRANAVQNRRYTSCMVLLK